MKYKVTRDISRKHIACVLFAETGFVIRKYDKHEDWESNRSEAQAWVDSLRD